jgi:hypothetical protein
METATKFFGFEPHLADGCAADADFHLQCKLPSFNSPSWTTSDIIRVNPAKSWSKKIIIFGLLNSSSRRIPPKREKADQLSHRSGPFQPLRGGWHHARIVVPGGKASHNTKITKQTHFWRQPSGQKHRPGGHIMTSIGICFISTTYINKATPACLFTVDGCEERPLSFFYDRAVACSAGAEKFYA